MTNTSVFQYNKTLSELIARKYERLCKNNQCYENTFRLMTKRIPELGPFRALSALYCYLPSLNMQGNYFRHAFCIHNGAIIEPLDYLEMERIDPAKIVPIRLMGFEEYLELITQDGKYDMEDVLLKDGIRALADSGIELNPVDMSSLLNKINPILMRRTESTEDYVKLLREILAGRQLSILDIPRKKSAY